MHGAKNARAAHQDTIVPAITTSIRAKSALGSNIALDAVDRQKAGAKMMAAHLVFTCLLQTSCAIPATDAALASMSLTVAVQIKAIAQHAPKTAPICNTEQAADRPTPATAPGARNAALGPDLLGAQAATFTIRAHALGVKQGSIVSEDVHETALCVEQESTIQTPIHHRKCRAYCVQLENTTPILALHRSAPASTAHQGHTSNPAGARRPNTVGNAAQDRIAQRTAEAPYAYLAPKEPMPAQRAKQRAHNAQLEPTATLTGRSIQDFAINVSLGNPAHHWVLQPKAAAPHAKQGNSTREPGPSHAKTALQAPSL
jgi:hypothetical protein